MDAKRKAVRRIPTTDFPTTDIAATATPAGFDPDLLAALDQLTEDQREVVVLRFVADLSLEAVAKLTRRKVGAVKALQHRALENLSRAVSKPD